MRSRSSSLNRPQASNPSNCVFAPPTDESLDPPSALHATSKTTKETNALTSPAISSMRVNLDAARDVCIPWSSWKKHFEPCKAPTADLSKCTRLVGIDAVTICPMYHALGGAARWSYRAVVGRFGFRQYSGRHAVSPVYRDRFFQEQGRVGAGARYRGSARDDSVDQVT